MAACVYTGQKASIIPLKIYRWKFRVQISDTVQFTSLPTKRESRERQIKQVGGSALRISACKRILCVVRVQHNPARLIERRNRVSGKGLSLLRSLAAVERREVLRMRVTRCATLSLTIFDFTVVPDIYLQPLLK